VRRVTTHAESIKGSAPDVGDTGRVQELAEVRESDDGEKSAENWTQFDLMIRGAEYLETYTLRSEASRFRKKNRATRHCCTLEGMSSYNNDSRDGHTLCGLRLVKYFSRSWIPDTETLQKDEWTRTNGVIGGCLT
jgi:hypothetical protein